MIRMFNRKVFARSISLGMSTVVLIGAGLLAGCTTTAVNNNGGSTVDNNTPPASEESKQDKIMPEFMALVDGNSKPDVLIEFMDKNIAGVTKENASKMLEELEKSQKNHLLELEDKYYNGETIQSSLNKVYKPGFDLNKLEDIQDAELKSLLEETRDMGYKVETAEGTFFPIMNYEYMKKFSPYTAEDMKAYIDIMAVETNEVPAKDAALMIGWDEVIGRALAQEDFIKKYGSSSMAEGIKELQKKYTTFMLFGLNNTPLFSYETKEMDPEARKAYTKAAEDNAGSELMQLLSKYMEVLEKSDYKLSDEADKFRKDAVGNN